MKSPDRNQEKSFLNNTKSSSQKSKLRKTTEYAETPDRKPRITKEYSSNKKTPLTDLKGLKTQARSEDVLTNFNADQQDSLVDVSDVASNAQNKPINDDKLKRGRAAHSVSPKKHRVGNASDRRRTVAEYPQSTAYTNQKQNNNSVLLKNKTPDRRSLKSLSPKEKKLLESATSRRTTVDRSDESSFGNTQNAFDDENTVANNYIETSLEDVNCAGPSKDIDSSVDDFDLLDRAKDIRTVKKTCLSVSSKKRSFRNSSNRRKTVAEYPQSTARCEYSERKIESDLFEDSGIHQQNVDDGELLDKKSLKLTDADWKTPIKKLKNTRTVSLKKPTPLRTSKGRRRTVGDFGDGNYQKFESANTSNQPVELHNINNSQNEDNSEELEHNLSNDQDLFANVYDNNVIKNRRMCHSVSPQKPSLRDSTNRRKTVAQYPQLSVGLDQSDATKSYVNEDCDRQESDYSDVMANISLNKPLRRRKGYSLNTRKAIASFKSRRKTLGALTKTPKVKSWKNLYRFTQQSKNVFPISRRATTNFTSNSLPASSASRRSFTDFNLKKIVPKVDEWKTEAVTITPTTIGSKEPKSAHTSRKIENKVPIKSDPNQLDLESEKILNKPVEALRRTTRKRAVSKEENLELVEEPTKITPKRNTRRAKRNENIDVNDDGLLEKPKKVVGTRKGRGKKMVTEDEVVADQIKINTSTNVNAEAPQLTTQDENVTKSLVEIQTPVENSVGLTEKRNLSNEDVSSIEVPTKATKKRKLNKNDLQESAIDTPTLSESAQTVRSTRKLVKEDSPVQNSPAVAARVTRKRNIVQEALTDLETEENIKSTRGKTKSEPAKSRRGRSSKTNNSEAGKVEADKTEQSSVSGNEKNVTEEPLPKRPTKGRKAVVKKTDKSPILAEAPVAQIVLEPVKAKGDSTRGKKVVTENIAVPAEEAVAEVELEQVKPKRATRGRKAITKNIEETPVEELVAEKGLEPVKPKNSTRRKAVDEAASVEDLEPVEPKKVTRGKKAVVKNISETPGEELDQASRKTTRGKKAVAENASPLVEDSVAVEDAKLNKPKKTTRGKKAVSKNTEETVVNQVPSEESVQPKRSARGRRAIQADAAIDKEPVAADEPIADPKVS